MIRVSGVCAVLGRPTAGRGGLVLDEPAPLVLSSGAPVYHLGQRVGTVGRFDLDGLLLRWTGLLTPPAPA